VYRQILQRNINKQLHQMVLSPKIFEAHPIVVTRALKHGYPVPNIFAKAGLWSPAEEDIIIQWITLNSQKARHMTRSQSLNYATETLKNPLSRGSVNWFLWRHKSDLWETQVQPQEESKFSVPLEFLVLTLDALQAHVHGHFCDLVFDLDEMGML
jgi:hypothetical protein